MCEHLLTVEPDFENKLKEIDRFLADIPNSDVNILQFLKSPKSQQKTMLERTKYSQPILFGIQVALATL